MFLKYPKQVLLISSSYINSNSKISVIKKDLSDNKNKYVIKRFLSESDIEHKTEIYTTFGRFKILNMNNMLYIKCQRRKPSSFPTTMNKAEYISNNCVFISDNLENKKQNLLSIMCTLRDHQEEYLTFLDSKLN